MKSLLKSALVVALLAGSAIATASSASAHENRYGGYSQSSWYGGYHQQDRGDRGYGDRGWSSHRHMTRDRFDRGYEGHHGHRDRSDY